MNDQVPGKRDFGGRPAGVADAFLQFPLCTSFSGLGFEGERARAKGFGNFLMSHHCTVHGAHPQGAVDMRIEVDQQAVRADAHIQQAGAPGARVIRLERRINHNQAVLPGNCAERDTCIIGFNINMVSDLLHTSSSNLQHKSIYGSLEALEAGRVKAKRLPCRVGLSTQI